MDFKVFLSNEALGDLERIVAYIAPHNPAAAERLGNQLLDAALSLQTLPERGRAVPEFRQPQLREIIFVPIALSTGSAIAIKAWK